MIVAHNTGKSLWTPQTPDGAQEGLVLKPSGADCRCFVIVAIMSEFVAPRSNGALARYKWLPINGKDHAVDQERSETVVREYPNFPVGMRAAQKFWGGISSLIFVGGFVALILSAAT